MSRPVDVAWLVVFRVLFGASMCASMLRFLAYGWIDEFFLDPPVHFKYWGFAWAEPLPRAEMYALFWILAVLALAMTVGLFYRAAAVLFFIGFTYLQLIDVCTYLNHYYLASLLLALLALSPAHRAFSLDARRTRSAITTVPAFWLYLFRFQIGVVYTFAGLAKAQGDWLVHGQPLRIWLGSETDLPWIGAVFTWPGVPTLMSWGGFCFDTSVTWLLLARRTRPYAYVALLVFHTLTGRLFPIGMFPVIMTLAALVFFPPDWPRRLQGALRRHVSPTLEETSRLATLTPPTTTEPSRPGPRHARVGALSLALAAIYCAFQITMPLRFLAYGGNVLWHEQGMRFSWRVMVREKNGSLTYLVREKMTGRVRHVSPRSYLTRIQEREISTQPDLILQLGHHIRDDFERRGFGPVEVRVDAFVSLNGRKLARLIDPEVDLGSIEDGIGAAAWILPAPTEAPPHTRPI
jgi:hypothetical protein